MKNLLNKMKKLNENKNGKVITFDFDNTIVKSYEDSDDGSETLYKFGGINKQIIARIKKFKQAGSTVLIVTSRLQSLEDNESSVDNLLKRFGIEVDGVFYTNGERKAKKLYELGSSLHYDDDAGEREAIEAYKKLHPSDIVVKNPDDLLKDINEISKGLIFTNDNKIIIAQRSDSFEWDAPGGHLMEGEEGNFAFYREVLEELSLKIKKTNYLSSLNTTWKGEDKLVHYFIGKTHYNSDELEGVIQLQWEVADYFCGDLEEILKKMGEGATQNLKNAVELFQQENVVLENVYPHSTNHSKKKRRIIGFGGSKSTGAKGLKKVKDFSRSKSAPPEFGVLEEKDKKTSKKIKISITSSIEEKKKRKKKKKPGPKKGSKRKKRRNYGSAWPYIGGGVISSTDSGEGGDGGGGE